MGWTATTAASDPGYKSDGKILSLKASNETIYKGDLVRINAAGYATVAAPAQYDMFAGIALETVDNSGGSAGDLNVLVLTEGTVTAFQASAAITDVGEPAWNSYQVDAQTILSTTVDPTNSTVKVGTVVDRVFSNYKVPDTTRLRFKMDTFWDVAAE